MAEQPSPRKAVAPANENLLKRQNEALWTEYLDGAWAHRCPEPEAGGLLVRMPLNAQLAAFMRRGEAGLGDRLRKRLLATLPTAEGDASSEDERFERWSSNTVFTYRLAESMVEELLEAVASKSQNGKVSLGALDEDMRELISLYSAAQDSWQEVALVLRSDSDAAAVAAASGDAAPARRAARECLVINRPSAPAALCSKSPIRRRLPESMVAFG